VINPRLLRQAIETCVPLQGLGSPDGLSLGYPAAQGLQFPIPQPMVILFRRTLYPTPSAWCVVGIEDEATETIQEMTSVSHESDQGYQYTACRTDGNGYISEFAEPVRLDYVSGALVQGLPVWPIDLDVTPIAAGEFRITWLFDKYGGSAPADFAVYAGADGDNINYGAALGTVNYSARGRQYEYETSESYADGTARAFAVRARKTGGTAELNTFTSGIYLARTTVPTDASISYARQIG